MKKSRLYVCFFSFIIILGCHQQTDYVAAVTSGHPEATKIGVQILNSGGNAIDAAIGVQLALAVCLPNAGNIGGGGFMVYRNNKGEIHALDFREKGNVVLLLNSEKFLRRGPSCTDTAIPN